MKRVAYFGGSFDPITNAHIRLAWHSLNYVDEVWLSPVYQHMHQKKISSSIYRVEMIKLFLEEFNEKFKTEKIKLQPFECNKCWTNSTYNLLEYFKVLYPDIEFSIIIGQDNADKIHLWENWEELIENYQFIVFPRSHGTLRTNENVRFYTKSPHQYVSVVSDKISSTKVRSLIKSRNFEDAKRFLHKKVFDYIIHNGIYSEFV